MADDKTPVIRVELPSGTVKCSKNVARLIAYLAEHEAFFNDPRTTGNVVLSFKAGDMQVKQDIIAQV